MISETQLRQFNEEGFLVVRELFSQDEVEFLRQHYDAMRIKENTWDPASLSDSPAKGEIDPLKVFPRLMQMHRRDETSLRWLVDPRINQCLTALLKREPFAVQTMLYFKPPGARGQALHQDQYYLRAQPGTCIAAWMALDSCDEQNGCLQVVRGSQNWPLLCTVEADSTLSFTDVTVELPKGTEPVPVTMNAGDVLFFNGQLVHGSLPNVSQDRFRRSLIAHYIMGEAEQVYKYYHPVLRMDGSPVELGLSAVGGTCGTWVEKDGEQSLEMQIEAANR